MKLFICLGLLNLISLFLIKKSHQWKSSSGVSFFEVADVNKDGKITEEEGLTNPNQAIVKEWVAILEKIPKHLLIEGLTRLEYDDYLRNPNPDSKSIIYCYEIEHSL